MNNRVLLAFSVTLLASLSAGAAHADDSVDPRIDKAEMLLLKRTASNQSVENRLDELEMNLYGKTKHGSVSKRIDAISDFLGIKDGGSGTVSSGNTGSNSLNSGSTASSSSNSGSTESALTATQGPALNSDAAHDSSPTRESNPIQDSNPVAKAAQPQTSTHKEDSRAEPNSNAEARDLLRQGMKEFSNGQYRDAEDTFRHVLTVDPRNADAFYNLGSLAERNHDYVIALTNYRAALNFNASDKDYIAAVTAMEKQLSVSAAKSKTAKTNTWSSTHPTQTATLGHFKVPVDAATASDPLNFATPISGGGSQPFQLSGTKNDVMMNTTQFTNNYPTMSVNQWGTPPTMSVNQSGPPPTMGVAQHPPKNGGGFGKVLNVGMRAALYSSGLHCPICRMMGGGFHF